MRKESKQPIVNKNPVGQNENDQNYGMSFSGFSLMNPLFSILFPIFIKNRDLCYCFHVFIHRL